MSDSDVNIIGESLVPKAFNFEPLAIISVEASAPVPAAALIIVPAGIVKVTPSVTATRPLSNQIMFLSNVKSEVIFPSNVELEKESTSTIVSTVSVTVSTIVIYSIIGSSSEQAKNVVSKVTTIRFFNFNIFIFLIFI